VFNHLLAGLIDGLFLIPLESDFYSRMEDFFLSGGNIAATVLVLEIEGRKTRSPANFPE
jgi:hypothetical protein